MLFKILAIGFIIITLIILIDSIDECKETGQSIYSEIGYFVLANIMFDISAWLFITIISWCIVTFSPYEYTSYSFNINSLNDNLVTSGEIYGNRYSIRGSIDGEISYFFSKDTDLGEIIGHIPSDKTYIQYDNESEPYIEVHQRQNVVPEWTKKVFNTDDMINDPEIEYYILVVPEGTIVIDGTYQIDLE